MLEAEASLARSRHALEVFSHVALCTYERVYETVRENPISRNLELTQADKRGAENQI